MRNSQGYNTLCWARSSSSFIYCRTMSVVKRMKESSSKLSLRFDGGSAKNRTGVSTSNTFSPGCRQPGGNYNKCGYLRHRKGRVDIYLILQCPLSLKATEGATRWAFSTLRLNAYLWWQFTNLEAAGWTHLRRRTFPSHSGCSPSSVSFSDFRRAGRHALTAPDPRSQRNQTPLSSLQSKRTKTNVGRLNFAPTPTSLNFCFSSYWTSTLRGVKLWCWKKTVPRPQPWHKPTSFLTGQFFLYAVGSAVTRWGGCHHGLCVYGRLCFPGSAT